MFAAKGIVVKQKLSKSGSEASVTVSWYITETQCKMKFETTGGKYSGVTWVIPDVDKGALLMYSETPGSDGIKTYFSVPLASIKPTTLANVSRVNVLKTGETQTIAGVTCEKMIIKTNLGSTEMWVTSNFKPALYKFYSYFQNSMELLGLNNDNTPGVPVSSVTKDISGKVTESSEAISVTETELNPSDFTVPSDYQLAK